MEGQDIHAGYDPVEGPLRGDGQELDPLLGHDGSRLGEGVVWAYRQNVRRHDLAHGHPGALQRLLPVLVPVAQGDEATQEVEEARSFDIGVLEDQVSLGEYPDQPLPFDDRGSRDTRLGEELDHVLYCLLRVERGQVGLHYVPYPQLPDVLLVHEIPLVNSPTPHGTPLIVNGLAPEAPRLGYPRPAHRLDPRGPALLDVEVDEHAVQDHGAPLRHREPPPLAQEQADEAFPVE